ncbi:DUF2521 family protein [Aneurinibacillus terranovensis]|uniref:DUF2521 family protein n=1 Tax=Aneurinibacillus terranovensis TaxID=278991 RepID=UPI0004106077|nr:DUF2521 family protein [Aneurinibacillus terranovensis]
MDNVVSFQQWSQEKDEWLREKVLDGIDGGEILNYCHTIIRPSISHLRFLQRYMVERFLLEIIAEFFYVGVQASKLYRTGRSGQEIEQMYEVRFALHIQEIADMFKVNRCIGEWDAYSVFIIAEDLSGKWFRKGMAYGEKQRKLRLL